MGGQDVADFISGLADVFGFDSGGRGRAVLGLIDRDSDRRRDFDRGQHVFDRLDGFDPIEMTFVFALRFEG